MHAGGDALAAQAESFILAITKNHPVPVDGAEGRRVLKLALDIGRLVRERLARFVMNSKPIQMVDPAGEYRSLKAEIDAAVAGVFGSGPLHPRPRGRGARARDRAVHRRGARRRLQLGHRRAALAAGRRRHRARRRSRDSGLHLLRHRRGGVVYRRDAGVRGRGCGRRSIWTLLRLQRTSRQEDEGGHRGPPLRPMRRARRDHAHLQGEKASPGRRLRAVHRRGLPGQARGKLGRFRRLLLLSDQEPRRRGRCGSDNDQQSPSSI